MKVELTIPQAEYFKSTAKSTAVISGFGAGKTQTLLTRMIATMIKYPKANMLYLAPTVPLIRDILYPKLYDFLPAVGLDFSINKTENIVYIHGLGKIFCRSGDNPERIVGMEVVDTFIDEIDIMATEKAWELWRKAKARCRQRVYHEDDVTKNNPKGEKKTQQWVASTPEGFKFCYEAFKKNPIANSHLVRMSTYSNPYLQDDYIDDLKASYPPQLISAYLNGQFVNLLSDTVWCNFDTIRNSIETPKKTKKNVLNPLIKIGEHLHIGQDFNVGRGCAVVYIERTLPKDHPQNPTTVNATPEYPAQPWQVLIGVDEVYNSFDTPDTIRVLNEKYPKHKFPNRLVYPDATGISRKSVNATISDLALVKQAGFTIKKKSKNPSIKDRVASGNASFYNAKGETRVYYDKQYVPQTVDSLIKQVYNKNGLPQKGEGKLDDISDAATYPIHYKFPIKRQRVFTTTVRGL